MIPTSTTRDGYLSLSSKITVLSATPQQSSYMGLTATKDQSQYLGLTTTRRTTPTERPTPSTAGDGYLSLSIAAAPAQSAYLVLTSNVQISYSSLTTTRVTTPTEEPTATTARDGYLSLSIAASPAQSSYLVLTSTKVQTSHFSLATTTATMPTEQTIPRDGYLSLMTLPASPGHGSEMLLTFTVDQNSDVRLLTTRITTPTAVRDGYLSLSSKVTIAATYTSVPQSSSLGSTRVESQNSYLVLSSSSADSALSLKSTSKPQTSRTVESSYLQATHTSQIASTSTAGAYLSLTRSPVYSAMSNDYLNQKTSASTSSTYLSLTSISSDYPGSTTVSVLDPSSTASAAGVSNDRAKPGKAVILIYPMHKYFTGAYLPVMLAVLYRLLWTSVYATVKIMEPFYQLTQPDGALGKDSLTTYYQSSGFTPEPIQGYLRGHWVVLWSSLVYLAADLMAPLASETLFTDTKSGCTGGTGANPCFPRLSVDRLVARLMQGLLGGVAVLILVIMLILFRRKKTGVFADPSSIATVASLLNHEHVVEDFQKMDSSFTDDEMKKTLKEKRYRLAHYKAGDGAPRYGVVPVYDVKWANARNYVAVHQPNTPTRKRSWLRSSHLLLILRDSVFLLVLLGILGLVVAYYKAAGDTPFNVFMNSQSFGPRFIMTAVASIIGSQWKRLEREIRIVAPYKALFSSPSDPRSTLLFRSTTLPITIFCKSLYHGHFFLAFIAFVAILSEILVIMLAGVPFQSAQTWMAFLVSSYLSMAILGIMIIALVAIFWWRAGIKMPRMPDTLAAVWTYVCASFFLDDFKGLEGLDEKERDKRIRQWGKKYEYGQKMGVDGVIRWAVDEDLGSASLGPQGMREEG
ncbi:MAG: hypothetical protein M1812_007438 [Candelaria pacifica]|nr:MAG: hypothetical protein M1812_007438 [Candelaria pacifica]